MLQNWNVLVNSGYRGDNSRKGWTTEADLLDGIRTDETTLTNSINDKHAVILACKNDEQQIIACVYLKQHVDHVYLGMLTVSPELQGKGTGKLLLQRHGYYDTGERQAFPSDDKLESQNFRWNLSLWRRIYNKLVSKLPQYPEAPKRINPYS